MQYKQQLLENAGKLLYVWFEAMHTRFDLVILADQNRNDLLEICNEIEQCVQISEKIANRFNPESELSYINRNAVDGDTGISPELCTILTDCLKYNELTNGYFDISVYSENGFRNRNVPYLINQEKKTICFSHNKIQLDLSGFIKGYALGKVAEILENNKIDNALLNFGNSSILAKGNHPFGTGWKINTAVSKSERILLNECMTTSGNSEKTKWPIINPENGEIKTGSTVSVITKSPAEGEVLSKAAYLAPENELKMILKCFNAEIVR